jgi:RHS repeat-associated protein
MNIVAITNSGGTLTSRFDFEPYGQTTGSPAASYPFAFTGRVPINANVLYFRNRYYDSSVGRFLSEDPEGFRSRDYNLDRYVFNNPLAGTDPAGLQVWNTNLPLDPGSYDPHSDDPQGNSDSDPNNSPSANPTTSTGQGDGFPLPGGGQIGQNGASFPLPGGGSVGIGPTSTGLPSGYGPPSSDPLPTPGPTTPQKPAPPTSRKGEENKAKSYPQNLSCHISMPF